MYLSWRVFCVMVAVQAFSSFPSLLIYKLLILKISNWKWSATTYISTIISTVTTTVIACQPLFRDQVTEAVHTYASRSTHTYASRTYFYHYHLFVLQVTKNGRRILQILWHQGPRKRASNQHGTGKDICSFLDIEKKGTDYIGGLDPIQNSAWSTWRQIS